MLEACALPENTRNLTDLHIGQARKRLRTLPEPTRKPQKRALKSMSLQVAFEGSMLIVVGGTT